MTVDLGKLPFDLIDLWWFDPAVGSISFIETTSEKRIRTLTPPARRPGQNDYLLVMTDGRVRSSFLGAL